MGGSPFRWLKGRSPSAATEADGARRDALLADYVAAEDALRVFTNRNFGRLCAICARWTLLAAKTNAAAAAAPDPDASPAKSATASTSPAPGVPVTWRLSSWVTNCCNANHALESMSESSLAGIVATRAEGKEWWRRVRRAEGAPCNALTDTGCHLQHGRPELCNKYFCEAVRDYLWQLGGERDGPRLAARLDNLQTRWARVYSVYGEAVTETAPDVPGRRGGLPGPAAIRRAAGWAELLDCLTSFDQEIARAIEQGAKPVTADLLAHRLFKVDGDATLYEPFFEAEASAIGGSIRAGLEPDHDPG
jgi:hypothetical protein